MTSQIYRRHGCLYVKKSYKRNQDVVQFISKGSYGLRYVAGVVDGWNNDRILKGDISGRIYAHIVAKEFPKTLFQIREKHFPTRSALAAKEVDATLLLRYKAHVSSTGAFLFSFDEFEYIVSIGSGWVLEWTGTHFRHVRGIDQHLLNSNKYPTDTSRFFGRGELKDNPMYSSQPDVVRIDSVTPIFIATDGLSKMMTLTQFNRIAIKPMRRSGDFMVETLLYHIDKLQTQSDDITVLLRDSR